MRAEKQIHQEIATLRMERDLLNTDNETIIKYMFRNDKKIERLEKKIKTLLKELAEIKEEEYNPLFVKELLETEKEESIPIKSLEELNEEKQLSYAEMKRRQRKHEIIYDKLEEMQKKTILVGSVAMFTLIISLIIHYFGGGI